MNLDSILIPGQRLWGQFVDIPTMEDTFLLILILPPSLRLESPKEHLQFWAVFDASDRTGDEAEAARATVSLF
jgi:hypothetical protein